MKERNREVEVGYDWGYPGAGEVGAGSGRDRANFFVSMSRVKNVFV
jgi:hypothetical protein